MKSFALILIAVAIFCLAASVDHVASSLDIIGDYYVHATLKDGGK